MDVSWGNFGQKINTRSIRGIFRSTAHIKALIPMCDSGDLLLGIKPGAERSEDNRRDCVLIWGIFLCSGSSDF